VAACVACVAPGLSRATPDAKAQGEIDHLLAYVASSGCRFVRGGVEHDAREARDHLALKLDVARPLLGSADALVERVASASSLTGEPYRVRCDGRETAAKAWLADELARYRRAGGARAQ